LITTQGSRRRCAVPDVNPGLEAYPLRGIKAIGCPLSSGEKGLFRFGVRAEAAGGEKGKEGCSKFRFFHRVFLLEVLELEHVGGVQPRLSEFLLEADEFFAAIAPELEVTFEGQEGLFHRVAAPFANGTVIQAANPPVVSVRELVNELGGKDGLVAEEVVIALDEKKAHVRSGIVNEKLLDVVWPDLRIKKRDPDGSCLEDPRSHVVNILKSEGQQIGALAVAKKNERFGGIGRKRLEQGCGVDGGSVPRFPIEDGTAVEGDGAFKGR